ncbi:MAG: AI-2E family transporter [Acidimicrobiales bacterium]
MSPVTTAEETPTGRRRFSGLDGTGRAAWSMLGIGLVTVGALWVLLRLFVIAVPLVVALLLAALLRPAADRLQAAGLSRVLAAWVVILGLLLLGGALALLVVPSVVAEAPNLSSSVSGGLTRVEDWLVTGPLGVDKATATGWADQLRSETGSFSSQVAKGALARTPFAVELVAGAIVSVVLAFFFVKDGAGIGGRFVPVGGSDRHRRLSSLWAAVTGYARALVVNAAVNATVMGIALAVLGIPLALPIAGVTFVASFVPIVGAVVSGVIAALVALVAVGPGAALVIVGVTVGIHHLEGYVVGPLIIGRATGIHPAVLILSVIVGAKLGGVPGAFLAGPVAAAIAGWLMSPEPEAPPAAEPELVVALEEQRHPSSRSDRQTSRLEKS